MFISLFDIRIEVKYMNSAELTRFFIRFVGFLLTRAYTHTHAFTRALSTHRAKAKTINRTLDWVTHGADM